MREARSPERAGACLATLVGCLGPPGAGLLEGEPLGTFAVEAISADNSCGPGSLGAPESFAFEVELSRLPGELFWDGRAAGSLRRSGEFVVDASVRVDFGARGACQVLREDEIRGVLTPDDRGVAGFSGSMSYSFSGPHGDGCEEGQVAAAGVATLPCSMRYQLSASRVRLPRPAAAAE
jgi:hypothetical protein